MKPRTKLQHRIMGLSLELRPINEVQEQWAYKECLEHKGFANKSSAFCLDCGSTFPLDLISRNRATCPECLAKLKIEKTLKTTWKQVSYFAIAELVEEFQVVRHFELYAYHKKGITVKYFLHEILQDWIGPDLKCTKVGRLHNIQGYCYSWVGDWAIREDAKNWYKKYDVYPWFYYPESKFLSGYRKYGIDHRLQGLSVLEAMKKLPHNPRLETLLKAKQYSLLAKDFDNGLQRYWPSIKICLRNRYKVKDAGMYIDYLELLRYFGRDLHNAKFVCPKNLKKEHDRLVDKKRERQKKESEERQRQRIQDDQKAFEKHIEPFSHLLFTEGNIIVRVLKTVQEFMEEGDMHKHCLYTNGYYRKTDSLVFSATVDNEPAETIEVSISKLEVLQSRGLRNNPTDHHDAIVGVVEKNLGAIDLARVEWKKRKRKTNVPKVQQHCA